MIKSGVSTTSIQTTFTSDSSNVFENKHGCSKNLVSNSTVLKQKRNKTVAGFELTWGNEFVDSINLLMAEVELKKQEDFNKEIIT